ncbi:MAG: type II toxin-antitoxin system VapC family toxin [Gammaproteobacteria bacterium]|nr:type II toxin-antitoxin system VapC family toxin [Gammaproteobacteria bacterium]
MKPTVYIETSVVSYLTARPSRDIVTAAYQEITREWWNGASERFELVSSGLVVSEAGAGDPAAAKARLEALQGIRLLDATADAEALSQSLLEQGAVPHTAVEDAAHIALAATGSADFLLTWNFRHMANAVMRSRIEHACRKAGYDAPVICPPNALRGSNNGQDTA